MQAKTTLSLPISAPPYIIASLEDLECFSVKFEHKNKAPLCKVYQLYHISREISICEFEFFITKLDIFDDFEYLFFFRLTFNWCYDIIEKNERCKYENDQAF